MLVHPDSLLAGLMVMGVGIMLGSSEGGGVLGGLTSLVMDWVRASDMQRNGKSSALFLAFAVVQAIGLVILGGLWGSYFGQVELPDHHNQG